MEVASHTPGTFCFSELNTRDVAKAKGFYTAVLGWATFDVPSAGGSYALARAQGKDVAGIHLSSHGGASWLQYVAVESADRTAARAAELGGAVEAPPFDVQGVGRMALLRDPAGARFALWQATGMIGARLADEPGAPAWYELVTHDLERATRFYEALFGWSAPERTIPEVGPYTVASLGDRQVAGLMRIRAEWGDVDPHWQVYFAVADCARAVGLARDLGGCVYTGPSPVNGFGRFAVLADPDGAVFCMVEPS
jgi:predicted enzyme related to lactoylglutathione lyase